MKKTIVLGASTNPERYSFIATVRLKNAGFEVVPVGISDGEIEGLKILVGHPAIENVDTVTLYIGSKNQPSYYDYILSLKPNRVIFNPGTENPNFYTILTKNNIAYLEACTLVMLSVNDF